MNKKLLLTLSLGILVLLGGLYYYHHISSKTSITLKTIDSKLLHKIINTLSSTFGAKVSIESIAQLTESDRRNLVLRISLKNQKNNLPNTVIFKQAVLEKSSGSENNKKDFDRFARDWAGLEFVNNLKTSIRLAPYFYGGSKDYRFILIEDLGEKHISLLDALLSKDRPAALDSLKRFMQSLGHLHADSFGKTNDYLAILHAVNPTAQSFTDDIKIINTRVHPQLEELSKLINIPLSANVQQEITDIINGTIGPGPFTTFIHGDCCPDNNFDNPQKNRLLLIDFEWGFVRNALLDGTYLRMNMPNCWGAKSAGAIPEDTIELLEGIYRQELIKKIPASQDNDAYQKAYADACAYWMLNLVMIIKHVLLKDDGEDPVRPRILSGLQAFTRIAEKYKKLPHLRSMAEQILQELKIRWPSAQPLKMFPAFKLEHFK